MEFVKAFNAQTSTTWGSTIPVVITVYEDRSFTFITKTPPAAVLIRQAIGIEKGSGEPNRTKVGTITNDQVRADRREEARRPQRARRRSGGQDHRGHRALDGRGGRGVMAKHGKTYVEARAKVDREREYTPARGRPADQGDQAGEVRRVRRGPHPHRASTSATPTSSCAARSRCRTGSARTSRSPSSPRATRRARPRRPARTSSAPRTSPSASRRASPTSTSPSRRRT